MAFVTAIIPARYSSTRFPGKPLADLEGRTMIYRVYHQVKQSGSINQVMVATDDDRILKEVQSWGGTGIMTSSDHPSGTDRCLEALKKSSYYEETDFVLNVQGDEPLIDPHQLDELVSALHEKIEIATQVNVLTDHDALFNENTAKVVLDTDDHALYFSRLPIPFLRNVDRSLWLRHHTYYQHIGIYAYRKDILESICRLSPSQLEIAEGLEQLRWIENGYRIKAIKTSHHPISVDVPEDAEAVRRILKTRSTK
jgi:3-deoxy-manno-octulosonate cytidylyltransferase (CMP-KDO synthetase)